MLKTKFLPFVLLALAVFAIFGRSARYDFTSLDDTVNVSQNRLMLPATVANTIPFWTRPYYNFYIPVTYSVWSLVAAADERLTGDLHSLRPVLFHCINLCVHAANGLLVFTLLRLLLFGAWPALFGALLFALHPIQVETVCWVTGLRDGLSALFGLMALYCYLRWVISMRSRSRRSSTRKNAGLRS